MTPHSTTIFSTLLQDFSTSAIIIGGDFNTVIHPIIDSKNSHHTKNWHSTQIIKQYMTDIGLGDSWRLQNASTREYTYFSSVHKSFSWIDYFLTRNSLIADISNQPFIQSSYPITLPSVLYYGIKLKKRKSQSKMAIQHISTARQRIWFIF